MPPQPRRKGTWKPQGARHNPRDTHAGRQLIAAVRDRVRRTGELCWFYRKPGYPNCPGRINLALPSNHKWGFTTHHTQRIMDGGTALPHPDQTPAAHRSCNATDGLRAQNARRKQSPNVTTGRKQAGERTSETW